MAHDIKSPGVSINTTVQTSYTAITESSVAAAVGFTEKGPVGVPTKILSKDDYYNTFGRNLEDDYYMGMFANKFLNYSTSYFTRIAKSTDYEAVTGTVAAGLDFTAISDPVFWVKLENFPEPNNGVYRVTWSAGSTYSTVDDLIDAINTAFGTVTLSDGSTLLSAYLTASEDSDNVGYIVISSDVSTNIKITIFADQDSAANVAKTTGVGNIGIADASYSADTNSIAYSYIRVPIDEVAATNASITADAAMTTSDLNQISAFNKINIKVNGDTTNPYKLYEDVSIVPATGAPATWPVLEAAAVPVAPAASDDYSITLAGFYHFMSGDVTGDVNTSHTITLDGGYTHSTVANLVSALNTACAAVAINANSLDDYVKFEVYETDKVRVIEGDGLRKNYGSQCSVTIADGVSGEITDLGYVITTNDSASGTDTSYTAAGVASKISSGATGATSTSSTEIVSIASSLVGGTSFIEVLTATTATDDALAILHFTTGDSDTGSNASNSGVINFVSKEPGTWGDDIKVRTYTSTNPITAATEYNLEVYFNDYSVEVFKNIDWVTTTSSQYITTLLANSDYITVDFGETIQYPNTDTDSGVSIVCPSSGGTNPTYWELDDGNNGIPTDSSELDALAVNALDDYTDLEQYVVDFLLAPGFTGASVVAKLQSVAEARGDVIAVPDPPSFLDWDDVYAWHNGAYDMGGGVTSAQLSSSYVAAVWDWQKDYDADNAQYVDLPPSIYSVVTMAKTQKNSRLWEAPAGPTNGLLDSISSYSKPTRAQREILYNDTDPACVNPIIQHPTKGIMIYGQKTCQRTNKPTNRINVRRLVNYVKRNIEIIGDTYIFRLNNTSTWDALSRDLRKFLGNIESAGGISSYDVICDSNTNSGYVEQGIIYAKVAITPVTVAERIFIDLTVNSAGSSTSET